MDSPKGFEKPNHTQTPNSFFDESLKHISSLPELKVVLAIIRKTLGWQKNKDKISMSQIKEMTGLQQQSVKRGIDLALEHGFIDREPCGQQFFYSLKLVTPRDQSHHVTSNDVLPEPVTTGDQKLVTPRDTQKKVFKEKKESKEQEPPFNGSEFLQALAAYDATAKQRKVKESPQQRRILFKQLARWGEDRATEALENCVAHSWRGVFEPKETNGNGSNQKRFESGAERSARNLRENREYIRRLQNGSSENNCEDPIGLLTSGI
jgi:phage replication O-like protein O